MPAWFYSSIHHFLKQDFGIKRITPAPTRWWARNGITLFPCGYETEIIAFLHTGILQFLCLTSLSQLFPSPPNPRWARIGWAVTHRGHLLGTDLGNLCCPSDTALMGYEHVEEGIPIPVWDPPSKGGPRGRRKAPCGGKEWRWNWESLALKQQE